LSVAVYASAAREPAGDARAALERPAGASAVDAGHGVRSVGDVLKALGRLIGLRAPTQPARGAGLPVVPGLLPGGISWASTAGSPPVLVIDDASWSTVRVAEASVCASPLIVGASAFVTGAKAFVAGVRALVAGAGARPAGSALFVAERSVGATAFVAGAAVVVTGATACAAAVAAFVTRAVPGAPVIVDVGALCLTGAAALVTGVAAFVTGAVARMTVLLALAADASAGAGVLAAGTVASAADALGLLALGAAMALTGVVAWPTGSATCWTAEATGCVACPTVPPTESAIAGDVHTAMLVRAASVTRITRDERMRSA
jgi:hypothetical protein